MKTISFSEFKNRYDVNFKAKKGDPDFIGQGGFGAVYKGHDMTRHFDVAVKRSSTDKDLLDEFERGRALPIHPNIARYIDSFRVETEIDEFDVAILQYYPHGNLDQLIAKKQLVGEQLDNVLIGVLQGLQFMHDGFEDAQGNIVKIIHRDLKPQNILIAEYNGKFSPLITDFGISRTVNKDDMLSTGGGVGNSSDTGTIVYKAPEQVSGSSIRTNLDLWAFGVMLFKILKGKLPFFSNVSPTTDAFKLDVMAQITTADLNAVLAQLSDQPQKYQDVLKACLVRDNKTRVQTAKELIEMLGGAAVKADSSSNIDVEEIKKPVSLLDKIKELEKHKKEEIEEATSVAQNSIEEKTDVAVIDKKVKQKTEKQRPKVNKTNQVAAKKEETGTPENKSIFDMDNVFMVLVFGFYTSIGILTIIYYDEITSLIGRVFYGIIEFIVGLFS